MTALDRPPVLGVSMHQDASAVRRRLGQRSHECREGLATAEMGVEVDCRRAYSDAWLHDWRVWEAVLVHEMMTDRVNTSLGKRTCW